MCTGFILQFRLGGRERLQHTGDGDVGEHAETILRSYISLFAQWSKLASDVVFQVSNGLLSTAKLPLIVTQLTDADVCVLAEDDVCNIAKVVSLTTKKSE